MFYTLNIFKLKSHRQKALEYVTVHSYFTIRSLQMNECTLVKVIIWNFPHPVRDANVLKISLMQTQRKI